MNHTVISRRWIVPMAAAAVAMAMMMTSSTDAQETATLRMTFKYKGAPPTFPAIKPTRDEAFCGMKEIPEESLVVNPDNNGIRNVVVWVKTGRRYTELPEMDLKAEKHTLANEACRFEPHVVLAKVGDTIEVTNPDKVGHNAKFNGFNLDSNLTVPVGGAISIELEEPEPSVIGVECNIHPWMKARLLVIDNPFAGVSDENGVLEIKGLPAGMEITFQANHETGSFDDITIGGKKEGWSRNRFELELEPGMNDLGVIEVPADAFE